MIVKEYETLWSVQGDDIMFSGYNKDGALLLGSWYDEDYENKKYESMYTVINESLLQDFKDREVTYLDILRNAKHTYIVETDYSKKKQKLTIREINFEDIPKDYLPTKDSYLLDNF